MKENEIAHIALENLQKNVGITGRWRDFGPKELDGQVEIIYENQTITFNAEIKQELRNHQLPQIFALANLFKPLIVIAQRIFPKIKEELRGKHIAYLEVNGNIYLKQDNLEL